MSPWNAKKIRTVPMKVADISTILVIVAQKIVSPIRYDGEHGNIEQCRKAEGVEGLIVFCQFEM